YTISMAFIRTIFLQADRQVGHTRPTVKVPPGPEARDSISPDLISPVSTARRSAARGLALPFATCSRNCFHADRRRPRRRFPSVAAILNTTCTLDSGMPFAEPRSGLL